MVWWVFSNETHFNPCFSNGFGIIADRLRWIFEHRNDTFNRHSREVKFSSVFPRIRHTFTGLWHIQHIQKTCQTDGFSTFHLCIFVRCANICIMKTICSGLSQLSSDCLSMNFPSTLQVGLGCPNSEYLGYNTQKHNDWIIVAICRVDFVDTTWLSKVAMEVAQLIVDIHRGNFEPGYQDTGNDGQI